jgi:ADP-heptose:LPS heptosyltransferase
LPVHFLKKPLVESRIFMPFPKFTLPLVPYNISVNRCPVSRHKATHRFLIVKFGANGDLLMTTPLLTALRRSYPDAHITWLVEHSNIQGIDANPHVDEIISWDGGYWQGMLSSRWKNWFREGRWVGLRWLGNALAMTYKLRQRRYDTFISFHPEQWPSLVFGASATHSIGVFESGPIQTKAMSDYRRLYQTSLDRPALPAHRTDIHLLPLKALEIPNPDDKCMVLGYTEEDVVSVENFLAANNLKEPFIIIAPLTTWMSRNWPEERFAELGDRLARDTGCRVVMIGSPKERSIVEQIAARMETNPVRAAGLFGFRGMAALIARASVLVSGDTGPMHVAAAVGTPYVALFGPTPVLGRAPLVGVGVSLMHPVPCGPCDQSVCPNGGKDHMLCMRLIAVDEVVNAIAQFLPVPV